MSAGVTCRSHHLLEQVFEFRAFHSPKSSSKLRVSVSWAGTSNAYSQTIIGIGAFPIANSPRVGVLGTSHSSEAKSPQTTKPVLLAGTWRHKLATYLTSSEECFARRVSTKTMW